MNKKLAMILVLLMFAGPSVAELIQATTGVQATMRECIEGETACDSFGRIVVVGYGGLPGNSESQSKIESFEYGSSSGSAKLLGPPGATEMTAMMKSMPGARNGGNTFFVQRYTNTSAAQEKITLNSTLKFDLQVPAENAEFPVEGHAHSYVSSEMDIFTMDRDAFEVGPHVMDNQEIVFGEELPEGHVSLDVSKLASPGNVTGSDSKSGSISALIAPGDSVWFFAILQSLGANGAVVEASLETSATIEAVAE